LEKKRISCSGNPVILRIPGEICLAAESFSLFGFYYGNYAAIIIAFGIEILSFETVSGCLVK
jgi:hypothetical protein